MGMIYMEEKKFSINERHYVFLLLVLVGGFFGAYTYNVRGGIFCNAQTANIVLLAMAIGVFNWWKVLYLIIPISAYFLGSILSEIMNKKMDNKHMFRWSTIFLVVEIIAVVILGFLPTSIPHQISQVTLNFICSMQFATFRKDEGVAMATTFVTNHIRETGRNFVDYVMEKDNKYKDKASRHGMMILMFIIGGIASTILCTYLNVRAIWGSLPILIFLLIKFIDFDVKTRKLNA